MVERAGVLDARNKTNYRTAEVLKGDIISSVNSTGTVQPVRRVQIGSFVSGPIEKIFVDYNSPVYEGMIMARIDPRLFTAQKDQAEANLIQAKAGEKQAEAKLSEWREDWERAKKSVRISTRASSRAPGDARRIQSPCGFGFRPREG